MLVDILILVFCVVAAYRGREIGFTRQLCSTLGFFGGLFLGALLQPYTIRLVQTPSARALMTLATTLGCAIALLLVGEVAGTRLKRRLLLKPVNVYDNRLGAVLSVVSLLFSVWLTAAIVGSLPFTQLQTEVRSSRIISGLDRILPSAPTVIADLGHFVDPNGFPQVFIGNEPAPNGNVDLPSLGVLADAVQRDRGSVVKIEGQGCGGIVEGSGFVVGTDLVATNAHVVAGIKKPFVQDTAGTHSATPVWFDPSLDFAVLRVPNLSGQPLLLSNKPIAHGTPAVVLGYPGGGGFTAKAAAVLDQFTASGRNIYGKGYTSRDVYEIQADIIPGNSGGPLVATDGTVIGVIFAESTSYQHVGYALTTAQVNSEIKQAAAQNQTVNTGKCAE